MLSAPVAELSQFRDYFEKKYGRPMTDEETRLFELAERFLLEKMVDKLKQPAPGR